MSFAIWQSEPPFTDSSLNEGEHIYKVGNAWVVTDQSQPTQDQVNAVINAPAPPSALTVADLAKVLTDKGVLTTQDLTGQST